MGAAATGLLLFLVADYAGRLPAAASVVIAGCSLGFPLWDVFGRRALTFPARQTYGAVTAHVSTGTAYVLWGIDVGLGFTTYRVSRNYWSSLVMLAVGVPALGFAGASAYVAALLAGVLSNRRILVPERRMLSRRRRLGVTGCAVCLSVLAATAAGLAG